MEVSLILLRENGNELEEAILELLSQAGQPLCVSTLSFLLNRPSRDICMALNRLQKYRDVQISKVTARRMQFWEVKQA